MLTELETSLASDAIREARMTLDRSLTRLDALEADFARLTAPSTPPLAMVDLAPELQELRSKNAALEGELQAERDLGRMREADVATSKADVSSERRRCESLMKELTAVKAAKSGVERDLSEERSVANEQREANKAAEKELETTRTRLAGVEEEVAKSGRRVVELETELASARRHIEEATRREVEANEALATTKSELAAAIVKAEEGEAVVAGARSEYIAERDRADALAESLAALRNDADAASADLREAKTQIADLETRRAGAANETAEVKAALRTAARAQEALKVEAAKEKSDGALALTQARKALRLAKALHDFNVATASSLALAPASLSKEEPPTRPTPSPRPPSPAWDSLDAASLHRESDALEAQRPSVTESVTTAIDRKVVELNANTRKWQKECKAYRDRAKAAVAASGEKIAFRQCVPSLSAMRRLS